MKFKRLLASVLTAAMVATAVQLPAGVFAAVPEGQESAAQISLSFEGNLDNAASSGIKVTTAKGSESYVDGVNGGQAFDLAGANALSIGSSSALIQPENLTISCWIKPDATLTGEHILAWAKGNWDTEGWYISLLDDNTPVKLSTGTGVQESFVSGSRADFFPVGEWTHLVVTYDAATNTCSIYRNGVAQSVSVINNKSGINVNSSSTNVIGYNGPYNGTVANISLDEFNLMNTCLSASDVVEIYEEQGGSIDRTTLAQADLDSISFASQTGITNNLSLPTKGSNGSTIVWTSSDESVIATDGTVTRPALGSADASVTLTATATNGTASVSKDFVFTVAANTDFSTLTDFDMEDVELTDTWLTEDFQLEVDYLLSLDVDKLLKEYYNVAGITTAVSGATVADIESYPNGPNNTTNWESSTNFRGNTAGHLLSGLAYAWINTYGDDDQTTHAQVDTQLKALLAGMKACQDANGNGYLGAFSSQNFTRLANGLTTGTDGTSILVPWWTMDAILSGLIHTAAELETADPETAATAKEMAQSLGEWIYSTTSSFTAAQRTTTLNIEYGGMNSALYNLYKLDTSYENADHFLTAAHWFDEESLFDQLYAGTDCLSGRHANTTIPKIIGAMNRYITLNGNTAYTDDFSDNAAAGDMSYYLQVAENFWDIVVNHHTYITSGNSWQEHFHAADVLDAYRDSYTNETCNVYNMLRLTRMLFEVTGNQKYADFYDNAYTNSILSAQNHTTGMSTYWQAMGTGYFKVYCNETEDFWCCTDTSMESFTKLNDSMYYHNDSSIYAVLLYGSTVNWTDKNLSLVQTDATSSDAKNYVATFTVDKIDSSADFGDFDLRIRVPDWSASAPTVTLNGQVITDYGTSGGFLIFNRTFSDGDVIEVSYPMTLVAYDLPDASDTMGLKYGPWVLSADLGTVDVDVTTLPYWGYGVHYATSTGSERQIISMTTDTQTAEEFIADIANHYTAEMGENGRVVVYLTDVDASQLAFTPHYAKDDTYRYGIYFTIGAMDSESMQETIADNKNANAATAHQVDTITANDDQRETNHNMQTSSSTVGTYNSQKYRQAQGEGAYFSYDMKVDGTAQNYLEVTFNSKDAGNTFAIYADDTLIDTVTLNAEEVGFFTKDFEIPLSATSGKEQVTIQFAAVDSESVVGPIYENAYIYTAYSSETGLSAAVSDEASEANGTQLSFDDNGLAALTLSTAAETLGVKFTPANVNAVVEVNDIVIDDTQVRTVKDLAEGVNVVDITVTAEDGTTANYTLTIYNGTTAPAVDKTALSELLADMSDTYQNELSGALADSVANFRTVYENAQAVYENENAAQEEVDAAYAALRDVMIELYTTVGYYAFDGDLIDSVTGESGTTTGAKAGATGGSVTYVDGVDGQAVYLDGTSGVKLPSVSLGSEYTVAFWAKVDTITNYTPMVFLGTANDWVSITPHGWADNTNYPMVWSCQNGNEYSDLVPSASYLKTGEWAHIAVTVQDGVGTIYFNGQAIGNGPVKDSLGELTEAYLGVNYWDSSLKGAIDELYFSNVAEDYDVIAALYAAAESTCDEELSENLLSRAILDASDVTASDYTADSYEALQTALAAAEAVQSDETAAAADLKNAAAVLQAAMDALVADDDIGKYGDVNFDGAVNVQDVMLLAQIVSGSAEVPDSLPTGGIDFNSDSVVNILDVMLLAQIANGKIV